MNPTIFLDLDGVVVDFIQGVIDWYGLDTSYDLMNHYQSILEVTGMSKSAFWKGLTEEFWKDLKWTSEGKEFYSWLKTLGVPIVVLTKPTLNRATGKQQWIMREMPTLFKEGRYLIGGSKHHVAGPGKLLIDDDFEGNYIKWKEHGGTAVLYPQPWNPERKTHFNGNKVDKVKEAILTTLRGWGV